MNNARIQEYKFVTALFKLLCAKNSSTMGYHLLAMLDAYAVIGYLVGWHGVGYTIYTVLQAIIQCKAPWSPKKQELKGILLLYRVKAL